MICKYSLIILMFAINFKVCKINTIGIGNGYSPYLVNNLASVSGGRAISVEDINSMTAQIVSLLEKSLTPCLDDFSFEFDKAVFSGIRPNPARIPRFIKNEMFLMYLFFDPNKQIALPFKSEVKLKFFDSSVMKHVEYILPIVI